MIASTRPFRSLLLAAAALVTAATLLGILDVASSGASRLGAPALKAPYRDPNAVGYIGLCDKEGHQVRSGSLDATPFSWRAVSSVAAPAPYDNSWRTAILLAYQPQDGLPSGEWSGEELTASSRYSDPAHPMVAATSSDYSLKDFVSNFHPRWDGFVELRIYLGTRDAETYSEHYPVLDIQVRGDRWHAVGGGPVDCSSGRAESLETIVLGHDTSSLQASKSRGTASEAASASKRPAAAKPSSSRRESAARHTPSRGEVARARTLAAAAPAGAPVSNLSLAAIALGVGAVLLGTAGFVFSRRRHGRSISEVPANNRREFTKGS